ncbi:MAG TPA: DNA topology modulation protein FlaR [Verrucomicrobiae bacterium]
MKPRVHIIGGPGSGKTYIASRLAGHFNIQQHDLDDLFWDKNATTYGVKSETSTRDRQLSVIVASEGWVIEGVYFQWLGQSFDKADVIIALTPSIWIRHLRIVKRFILRKTGSLPNKRESLADLWRLLVWGHWYDKRNLVRVEAFINSRGLKMQRAKNLKEVSRIIEAL